MKTKNKTVTVLALVVLGCAAGSAHLVRQYYQLKTAQAQNRQACEQKLAVLEADYQNQISQLKDYLLAQFDSRKRDTVADSTEVQDELEAVKPKLASYDETLEELVLRKYRFLFSNLNLSEADKLKLQQLLMERERINLIILDARQYDEVAAEVDIQALELQLAEIDDQIRALLDQDNIERFNMLRDSEEEQRDFTQYTLGINGIFPLTQEQQEKVLFAKLKYKKQFQQKLRSAGLYDDYLLSEEQRQKLLDDVKKAVDEYKSQFLIDVQQFLDNNNAYFDQYTLLENYETTEFNNMIKEFEKIIDKRAM